MKFSKTLLALLLLLTGGLIFSSVSSAVVADRTLTIGTGSGTAGATISLPITIDSKTEVAGASFTLAYDPTVFAFQGLETVTQIIEDCLPATDCTTTTPDYTTTMFYQVNDQDNVDGTAKIGRVMVAAASAQEFATTTLFNATFEILGGSGIYPIILNRTAVHNPQAGYATPTLLPVLVGLPAATPNTAGYYPTPTYITDLVDGSITVNTPGYTISGGITYTGGDQANGSTVTLAKLGPTGTYLFNGSTTVGNGTYSFSDRPAGTYKLTVMPYDAAFFMATATGIDVQTNTTQDFVLETATARNGTVTVNGSALAGVRVQVIDGNQNVLGVFPVNDQGYFETLPLPPGTYTYTALYGNVVLGTVAEGQTADFTQTLNKITGDIYTANSSPVTPVTVQVVSTTNQMLKTVTVDSVPGDVSPNSATYTIDNLLPGTDYIVSAVMSGAPVLYWNQETDITQAGFVTVSATLNVDTTADFDFAAVTIQEATIAGTVTGGDSATTPIGVFAFEITTYTVAATFSNPAASGAYSITVPPGSYRLFAISNGKVFFFSDAGTTRLVSEASVITLANGENGGGIIDISEDTCSLSGNITYEQAGGPPLAGAIVVAGNSSGQAATVSQQDGSYAITGLSQGLYQVGMNPMLANYALQFRSKTIDGTNCSDATLDFIIDTGNTVSGTVNPISYLGGNPIADAMIYMINEDTGQLAGGRMYFSDQNGMYSIGDAPDAVYTLVANHPDYQTARYTGINVIQDITQDITMDRGAFIAGTATEGDGVTAVAGVTIVAVASGATPAYAMTDASGNYAIYGLDAGKQYLLIASKRTYQREFSALTTPATDGSAVADFTMILQPSTFNLAGNVADDCGPTAIENARIIASYSPGTGRPDFIKGGSTDASGNYSITGLPQDSNYTVTMIPPGSLAIQRETGINGTVGGTVAQDFTIPCSSAISGNVTIATPAAAVYVVLFDAGTETVVDYLVLTTPTSGTTYAYSFDGLANTSYKVLAVAEGNIAGWFNSKDTITTADPVSPNNTADISLSAAP